MSSRPGTSQMSLTDLSVPQLLELRNQIDKDLLLFETSLTTLKAAQEKFLFSGACLERMPQGENSVLVPLSSSLYVPGEISDTQNVVIDIGTGFHITKTLDSAKDYFRRKIFFIAEQVKSIQAIGNEKGAVRKAISAVLKMKLAEDAPPVPKGKGKKKAA